MAITDTAQLTLLVETAYDREVEAALRAMPQFRNGGNVVTKKPAALAMPGDVVVFSIGTDLAPATTPLTETVDPTPTASPAPTRVQVTLNEYGNTVQDTLKLRQLAFSSIDRDIADKIAFNEVDSVDTLVQNEMRNGTNVLYVNGGNLKTASGSLDAVTQSDHIDSAAIRFAVTKLRSASVVPPKGDMYPCYAHPDVTADLQGEVGNGGWRQPHEYQDAANIWAGETGAYLGAFFIETPRCYDVTNANATPAKVYNTYFLGAQALAEASAVDPHVVVGPQTDSLKRFFTIGWYTLIGWKVFRQEALWTVKTSSSIDAVS